MFHKKPTATEKPPVTKKPYLQLVWQDSTASYTYMFYNPDNEVFTTGGTFYTQTYQGDKEWAAKIAEHYDIPLPDIHKTT